MIARLALRLAPVIAAGAALIAVYYLFVAGLALSRGNTPFGLFYLVYAIAGMALAVSLWRVWRGTRAARGRAPEAGTR